MEHPVWPGCLRIWKQAPSKSSQGSGLFRLAKRRCRERNGVFRYQKRKWAFFVVPQVTCLPCLAGGGRGQLLVAGDFQTKAAGSPLGLTRVSVPDVWSRPSSISVIQSMLACRISGPLHTYSIIICISIRISLGIHWHIKVWEALA